ncbi:hypothetical protein SAMN03159343_2128 [Klenkia marina]|uniref:Uncharacterized protein n=1 Tax=Klenkia marina TaxID=1960309 RepID=A0A1G4Y6Y1_9ACTN|nr:hypothetical protein [Klenkia marina]SCX49185.1 hypothetical protein SAMN03159343_2128 [Klenkia marina]
MSEPDRSRFTVLPDGPQPDEWVETTDTSQWPVDADRERRETLGETTRATYLGGPLP